MLLVKCTGSNGSHLFFIFAPLSNFLWLLDHHHHIFSITTALWLLLIGNDSSSNVCFLARLVLKLVLFCLWILVTILGLISLVGCCCDTAAVELVYQIGVLPWVAYWRRCIVMSKRVCPLTTRWFWNLSLNTCVYTAALFRIGSMASWGLLSCVLVCWSWWSGHSFRCRSVCQRLLYWFENLILAPSTQCSSIFVQVLHSIMRLG